MTGPDHHAEMEAHYAAGMERQELKWLADDFLACERRRSALAAAVTLCVNDERLTDLGTLKRAWFFSETGQDEPVGSLSWEQLRVMVRAHGENR